ncbi:transcription factor GTE9-like isoform X2 [Phragmites australis]|uniref:transcription factor GTE9-like isoform X2 n=1 Tax=Phragmites australis TaxID=29695 RepID=UPI002D774DF9|nr:transcription factor GTE9-like isoform X2 [Phragmites australis]
MMGKTHRFSKGHPLGFVPDYRHGVETAGESKRLGSPARIDSGSSCAPTKRKCVSMNTEEGEGAPGFNVPREVFSLPRMTAMDKKDLEMRLREELAQVRALQNRLFSRGAAVSMNGGVASAPGGDVHPKKKVEKLKWSNSVQSDRRVPPSLAPPVVSSTDYTASFKQCANLLKFLMTHKWSGPFLAPVDVVKLKLPDYFDIVKEPMDLGTIQKRLNAGMYSTPWDFAADVRLTFSNAMAYNPANNYVHVMATSLNKNFESRWKFIEKKLPQSDEKPPVREKLPQPDEKPPVRFIEKKPTKKNATKRDAIEKEHPTEKKPSRKSASKKDIFQKEDVVDNPVLQPKKRKTSPLVQDTPVAEAVVPIGKGTMTNEQKYDLSARLQSYGALIPDHVVEFIRSHAHDCDANEDELELDMDVLSDDILFEIQKLLDDYDKVNQSRNLAKEDTDEVESRSQYELINPSVHHEEGNELVDEDVDIGENDLPVSNLPPVVFEDETADRSSKHSTSSSSSDSESSSTDSSSSSGSDLDVKALQQNSGVKEKFLPVDHLDQEKDSLNTLSLPEQSTDPISVSADGEGENVSEKQVSPGKQIRAALLRSRFADTILKAREKALDQVTKKDPEKLRRKREELERLQREERARLQAEAKAADDARKRAEAAAAAEAAAEAKRQRELEREAARKALQEMERTVEINEGSLFLKDLEMLGSASGEQIPSSVGGRSPTHMPEALGFQLGGNPLEKLGLYMKNDEEDEEGDFTDEPVVDVEEGEID